MWTPTKILKSTEASLRKTVNTHMERELQMELEGLPRTERLGQFEGGLAEPATSATS
jgi:hypothetical protein